MREYDYGLRDGTRRELVSGASDCQFYLTIALAMINLHTEGSLV